MDGTQFCIIFNLQHGAAVSTIPKYTVYLRVQQCCGDDDGIMKLRGGMVNHFSHRYAYYLIKHIVLDCQNFHILKSSHFDAEGQPEQSIYN